MRVLPSDFRTGSLHLVGRGGEEAEEFLQKLKLRKSLQSLDVEGVAHSSLEEREGVGDEEVLSFDSEPEHEGRHESASATVMSQITVSHHRIKET